MSVYFNVSSIDGQCGGRLIYGFRKWSDDGFDDYTFKTLTSHYLGKMIIATFNQRQKWAYDACCKNLTWLGQSKPIKNPNIGNYIFTAIFKV